MGIIISNIAKDYIITNYLKVNDFSKQQNVPHKIIKIK